MKLNKYLNILNEEDDVEIPVKNPGLLEVPDGKNVEDLPFDHFKKLAQKKGANKIIKGLTNLIVWNKKKNPSLSKWADKMQNRISKEFGND